MIRTFIAVEVTGEVRENLLAQIRQLRPVFPHISWVKEDNLHLTLKFLGNLPPDDLPDIFAAAEDALAQMEAFSLTVQGVAAFPSANAPRVIHAGCTEGREELIRLAGQVEAGVAPLGYPPDARPYAPHFTLGRVKQPGDARGFSEHAAGLAEAPLGMLEVEEVVVFMSELKKQGARHTPMQRIALK